MELNLRDIFEQAKIALHVNGWARGAWKDPETGCVCAEGAILAAVHGEPVSSPGLLSESEYDIFTDAEQYLSRLISDETEGEENSVIGFNDRDTATRDDIVALFDRAIEKVAAGAANEG